MAADQLGAVLEVLGAAHVDAHGSVELERAAARRHLGAAVHDADLLAELVDEDRDALALRDGARQLAHRLAHHTGVEADERVAHFALDLRARHERGDRVDDYDIDRARAHQRLGDFQPLLAGVRLGHQQAVDVDAQRLGVNRVERVLGVDERGLAAHLLRLRDDVQRDSRLARGFRPVNLHDTAARQAADAQRGIQPDRAGRDMVDVHAGVFAQAHDRALAVLLLQPGQRLFQRGLFIRGRRNRLYMLFGSHDFPSNLQARGASPRMPIVFPDAAGKHAGHGRARRCVCVHYIAWRKKLQHMFG